MGHHKIMSSSSLKQQKRKKEIKQCALELRELSRMGDNKKCADCNAPHPKWVSVTIGCWICMTCSGYHRSLGTHLSFVKSTTLDVWNYGTLKSFKEKGGNSKIKEIYGDNKINDKMNQYVALDFVREKYVEKAYATKKKIKKKNKKKRNKQKNKDREQRKSGSECTHNSIDSDPKLWDIQSESRSFPEISRGSERSKAAMIPDLIDKEMMNHFHFISDLTRDAKKENEVSHHSFDALEMKQNTEKRGKAAILSKYNNNGNDHRPESWTRFQSSSPQRIDFNFNFNYNPYHINANMMGSNLSMHRNQFMQNQSNNINPKKNILSRYSKMAPSEQINHSYGDSKIMIKQMTGPKEKKVIKEENMAKNENENDKQVPFDPFCYIDDIVNNDKGYYVYGGNVSC